MKKVGILLLVLSFAVSAQEDSEDLTLLCIADGATGFSYSESSDAWEIARFNVSNSRYTFSKNDEGLYEFKEFGDSYALSICSTINDYGFAQCEEDIHDLSLNVETLRYQLIYPIGFVVARQAIGDTRDTPYIEIGTCTTL